MRSIKPLWGEITIPKGLVTKWKDEVHKSEDYYVIKSEFIQHLSMDVVVVAPKEPEPQSAGCEMEGKEAFVDYCQRYFVEIDDSRLYLGSGIELKRGACLENLPKVQALDFSEFEFWQTKPQACWALINGPITEAMYYTGFEQFLTAVHEDAESVTSLITQIMDFQVEVAKQAVKAGAEAIILADDFAFTHGLMIKKDIFTFYLLPIYKQALEELHSLKVPVLLHCDGNLQEIVEELLANGFDGLQSLEWLGIAELDELVKKHPEAIFMGNLPPDLLMEDGTTEDLKAYLNDLLEVVKQADNLIISSSSGLGSDMSIDKLLLMKKQIKRLDEITEMM